MKKTFSMIVPLLLLLLIAATVADEADRHLLPSPFQHPDECGRYGTLRSAICDPENHLTRAEKDIIEGSLNSLAHLSQGSVAIVGNLSASSTTSSKSITSAATADSKYSLTDVTEWVARATYEAWGVGSGTIDDRGFLIFLSLGDRTIYIAIGKGMERDVPRDELTSIVSNMKVKLRGGEHAQAIVVAILEIKLLLSLSSDNPLQMWNSGSADSNRDGAGGLEYELTSSPSSAPSSAPSPPPDTPRGRTPPPAEDGRGRWHAASAPSAHSNNDGALSPTKAVGRGRFGKSWPLLFPAAALFGQAVFHRLEGQLALADVVTDSQRYALDNDEAIAARKPTRCPHCLNPFFWPDDSAPPLTGSTLDLVKKSVNAYLGSKETYQTPGSLPCGHIHCSSCIRKFIKRGSSRGNDELASASASTSASAGAAGAGAGAGAGRRRGKWTATAEFCRNCPVCTTTLSDWAATLNRVQVDKDSALFESLQTSTITNKNEIDSSTSARLGSLLARINRNKEISYTASRLRAKYGIAAVIDGSIIYENTGGTTRGPYNAHRHYHQRRQGSMGSSGSDSFGFGFGFGGRGDATTSPSTVEEQSMATSDRGPDAAGRDTRPLSLAQKLLSRVQRSQTAQSISSSRSSQMTFATSGRTGAVSAPPPPTRRNPAPAPKRRDEGGAGAGVGGSW